MVIPGSPAAAAVATDLLKFMYNQIATIRAAKQLANALEAAQPAVEEIARLMRKDLEDLDKVVRAANTIAEGNDATEMSNSGLDSHRKSLIEAMKKDRDLSKKENREELAELSKLMADADTRYAVYQAKLGKNQERLRAARQLINAAGAALESWSAGHAQLAVAARNNQTVSTKALLDSAVELRDLVKRIREL